jgi:hypothetical protein
MTTNEERKARFFELMARFCQLGRLLPPAPEIEDGERHDDAKVILAEMKTVKAEMDAILKAAKRQESPATRMPRTAAERTRVHRARARDGLVHIDFWDARVRDGCGLRRG